MADTTNIDDLPSAPQNKVVLEKQETPEYEKMIAHDNAQQGGEAKHIPSAIENQKMMNELVSGIQQASASGATKLPSRDIPMNQSAVVQDPAVQPNYVPEHPNDDYIADSENMEDYMLNNIQKNNREDSIEALLENMQVPILLGILYFLFQLPVVRSAVHKYMPSLFGKDGNQNLGGYLFFSVLFALSYFSINTVIKKIEII
jgi:hypothetical protein